MISSYQVHCAQAWKLHCAAWNVKNYENLKLWVEYGVNLKGPKLLQKKKISTGWETLLRQYEVCKCENWKLKQPKMWSRVPNLGKSESGLWDTDLRVKVSNMTTKDTSLVVPEVGIRLDGVEISKRKTPCSGLQTMMLAVHTLEPWA